MRSNEPIHCNSFLTLVHRSKVGFEERLSAKLDYQDPSADFSLKSVDFGDHVARYSGYA